MQIRLTNEVIQLAHDNKAIIKWPCQGQGWNEIILGTAHRRTPSVPPCCVDRLGLPLWVVGQG